VVEAALRTYLACQSAVRRAERSKTEIASHKNAALDV
jgi:hypothetical protein